MVCHPEAQLAAAKCIHALMVDSQNEENISKLKKCLLDKMNNFLMHKQNLKDMEVEDFEFLEFLEQECFSQK